MLELLNQCLSRPSFEPKLMFKIRKDTVERKVNGTLIDTNKQNLTGILGVRGSGKSLLGEAIFERYHDKGYTCLDLWSAPNMEGGFWIFAKDGHKKRIPITILAPESFIIPEAKVDKFNGKFVHTRESLVKFVKLPTPTKKTDSEANNKILEILIETIKECRDKRRILVFNQYMFPNESEMFRILEILMRNLITISNNYFYALKPEDVGKKKKEEMTPREKNFHKMCFLMRESAELAPARLKGDKSGESTLIKKALLKFVRLARHSNIDGILDYQNSSDLDSPIRNQIDLWLIKRWTKELGGGYFEYVFRAVKEKRDRIFNEMGYNDEAFQWADSVCPPIEKLTHYWFYAVKSGDTPRLKKVPELHIRHKEPEDKWWKMTEIPIKSDQQMLSQSTQNPKKASTNDEKLVYLTVKELKSQKGNKKLNWKQIREIMAEKQKNGGITYHLDFKTMTDSTISKIYSRMRIKYESNLGKVGHASQA